jgi:hypothetical protein
MLYTSPVSCIQDVVFLIMNNCLVMKRPVSVHSDLELCMDIFRTQPEMKFLYSRVLLEKVIMTIWSENFLSFIEHTSCSQEPAPGPYPEPEESSPYPHTFFEIHF